MAPAIINAIIKSTIGARQTSPSDLTSLGPLTARALLTARDNAKPQVEPGAGMINPHDINNNAVFAIFGILGAGFVILGIWFFFWAKNGGFYFKENDWEEYKSTVLRRKGPNGTTLSGATESTVLGGGSVYKDVDDGMTNDREDATTVISATTGITGITGGVSDFSGREKRRKKREQKEREKERRREEKAREKEERKSRRRVGADGVLVDEEAEYEAKEHLRSYRHEKPARVGGINKESEASEWDGSTNPSHSTASGSGVGYSTESGSTVTSELIGNREKTPTSTPTKPRKTGEERASERSGGIRKVYSMADKTARREDERLRAEARRLAEKGRAHRREPSWHQSDDLALRRIDEQSEQSESLVSRSVVSESVVTESRAPESRIPGSWAESDIGTSSDVTGTKVYKHSVHIPVSNGGSSVVGSDLSYTEEKRRRRRG
ncbi:hypothetical protein B0T14DRAFT_423555 [Immersiella caudata]|uniref:Endosomal spry domain-containing protein n=1 Tax=Immersiella caudata TaxID=314043 RepID=A0AA39X357_9PEZI|nr:hypothetical protein B0T14DRAFT_423555 [Immersiella caudata]